MKKTLTFSILAVFVLSGCNGAVISTNNSSTLSDGGVLKSEDGGNDWQKKVVVSGNKNISAVDVLSVAVDPLNSQTVYIGTRNNGIFVTHDGAGKWEKLNFPPIKVYGVVVNPQRPQEIFATGVWQNRGKIYKSLDGGAQWEEIYTEPADGTVIISLAINRANTDVLLAGNSKGVIIKTLDGGREWKGLFTAEAPVTQIVYDAIDNKTVYFLELNRGLLRSQNGGDGGSTIAIKSGVSSDEVTSLTSIAVDPGVSGVVYVGTSRGIFKSMDFGNKWTELPVIGSAKDFPVNFLQINPKNSREIVYSVAQAIYKSGDGGQNWSTFQLDTGRKVKAIQYDPGNVNNIYIGLSK